jgi:hypothetical protein
MKGRAIPTGGFLDQNGKALAFGYVNKGSGTPSTWWFQGEVIASQQIGSDYYVFFGFVDARGTRCYAAFDEGNVDHWIDLFEDVTHGSSFGSIGRGSANVSALTFDVLSQQELAGMPAVLWMMVGKWDNPPAGTADSAAWENAHLAANQTFARFMTQLKTTRIGSVKKPALIDRVPKPGDPPNVQPTVLEFSLESAPLPKGFPVGLVPPGTTFVPGSGSGGFPFMFSGYVDLGAYEAQIGSAVQITGIHSDSGKTVIDFSIDGKSGQVVIDPANNLVLVTPPLG